MFELPKEIDYGKGFITRKVRSHGEISVEGLKVRISQSLVDREVGLKYIESDKVEVWYDYLKREALEFARNCTPPEDEGEVMFQVNDIYNRYQPRTK